MKDTRVKRRRHLSRGEIQGPFSLLTRVYKLLNVNVGDPLYRRVGRRMRRGEKRKRKARWWKSGWWERAKGWVRERGGARETDRGERGAWKRKRDEWKGKWILVGSQITRGTIDRNICRSVGVTHTAYIETRLYIEHRPCAERGERRAHTYLPTYIHTYVRMST